MSEALADIKQAQAAKRARTAANTPMQLAGPPRPSIEDVEDQGDDQSDRSGHHGHRTVDRQSSDQTQITSNAAAKKIDTGPSRVSRDPPQGSRNTEAGKLQIPMTTSGGSCSHIATGQPGSRAAPPAGPSETTVDLTEGDDEDDGGDGIPPGRSLHPKATFRAS
jgi:hypothetical protein